MPAGRSTTLEINRNVRRVLVSRWIDLGRVSATTAGTTVYLRGTLQKLPGAEGALNPSGLELIYQKIRQIKGVATIIIQLENWERSATGSWESKGDSDAARRAKSHENTGNQGTYRIGGD